MRRGASNEDRTGCAGSGGQSIQLERSVTMKGVCPVCRGRVGIVRRCGRWLIASHDHPDSGLNGSADCAGSGKEPDDFADEPTRSSPSDFADSGGFGGGFGNE